MSLRRQWVRTPRTVASRTGELLSRSRRTVEEDVARDPLLGWILLGAGVLFVAFVWYRVPNFAGADEYSRLLHPMKVAGHTLADPGYEGLYRGATDGRGLGATFYLFGLLLLPLFVVVVLTGRLDEFASLAGVESRWTLWHEVPAWFWSGSILLGRLAMVALALGCVYVVYRLGTVLRDRRTGRFAAALQAASFGLVTLTHEAGEDVPALFVFLVACYCAVRYVQTGADRVFLAGCALGGVAIAFKLTSGTVVFVLAAAYVARVHREHGLAARAYVRPRLLAAGAALGVATIYVGFPSVLVGGPEQLVERALMSLGRKSGSSGGRPAPVWYWIVEGYLASLGLPLAVAAAGGVVAAPKTFVDDAVDARAAIPLLVGVAVYLGVYSQWGFVRARHLAPTLPLLLVALAVGIATLRDRSPVGARALLAVLLLTSAAFSAGGVLQYSNDPRDEATAWMVTNVGENETVEVYRNTVADVAAIHGEPLQRYDYDEQNATGTPSLILNETAYTEWMTSMPDREPDYVQLTASEVRYAEPGHPRARQYPERSAYVRSLLDGELGYRVVAEFGAPTDDRTGPGLLLRAGVEPSPDQREAYVVILERTDE